MGPQPTETFTFAGVLRSRGKKNRSPPWGGGQFTNAMLRAEKQSGECFLKTESPQTNEFGRLTSCGSNGSQIILTLKCICSTETGGKYVCAQLWLVKGVGLSFVEGSMGEIADGASFIVHQGFLSAAFC